MGDVLPGREAVRAGGRVMEHVIVLGVVFVLVAAGYVIAKLTGRW